MVAIAPTEDTNDADWAEVQIHFKSPDGEDTGTYAARVEANGEVLTQSKSGTDEPSMVQKHIAFVT